MLQLKLYHTSGCHLCELAEALVMPHVQQGRAVLSRIDVADDDALFERYGMRIPVLAREAADMELGWPFSAGDLEAFLRQG